VQGIQPDASSYPHKGNLPLSDQLPPERHTGFGSLRRFSHIPEFGHGDLTSAQEFGAEA
jgi:hypothetical protein